MSFSRSPTLGVGATSSSAKSCRRSSTSGGGTSKSSSNSNVRVVCRVRPAVDHEISRGGVNCVKFFEYNPDAIEVTHERDVLPSYFTFDRLLRPEATQQDVYEFTAQPLISDVLLGYNATIFAYGQTGTGKTYTMEGHLSNEIEKGIIPRSVEGLFSAVGDAEESVEFTFKVTFVEIYMEKVRDLLDPLRAKTNLSVREDRVNGIYIEDVTEQYVLTQEELLGLMKQGATNRATAATGMNEGSSRSHSVFTITVGQTDTATGATRSGKLVLVDLAGSEIVRKSHASGQQLEEVKTINKSLSALGQVIYALTDEKSTHVPYRDSKLTRILQDSLGGNSKTVLIVAVSPSSYNANETVSTLRFGMRAKSIENKVSANQTSAPLTVEQLQGMLRDKDKKLANQQAHIVALQEQLEALQDARAEAILARSPRAIGTSASSPTASASTSAIRAAVSKTAKVDTGVRTWIPVGAGDGDDDDDNDDEGVDEDEADGENDEDDADGNGRDRTTLSRTGSADPDPHPLYNFRDRAREEEEAVSSGRGGAGGGRNDHSATTESPRSPWPPMPVAWELFAPTPVDRKPSVTSPSSLSSGFRAGQGQGQGPPGSGIDFGADAESSSLAEADAHIQQLEADISRLTQDMEEERMERQTQFGILMQDKEQNCMVPCPIM